MSISQGSPDELDPALAQAWREASGERPPERLDDAIRAAARRAVAAGPRPAGATFAQRWRLPLSIAALVVISASVALMISQQDAHLPLPTEEGGGLLKREQPAREGGPADAGQSRGDSAAPSARQVTPFPAMPAAERSADALSKTEARDQAPQPITSGPDAQLPARGGEQSAAGAGAPAAPAAPPTPAHGAAVLRDEPSREMSTSPETPMTRQRDAKIGAPEPGAAPVERDADEEAKSLLREAEPPQAAPQPAGRARLKLQARPSAPSHYSAEEGGAGALRPEEWIEEIRELRRKGQGVEAEVSLKAFRERYPDYAVPADLLAPR